jgi:hypothetical protein
MIKKYKKTHKSHKSHKKKYDGLVVEEVSDNLEIATADISNKTEKSGVGEVNFESNPHISKNDTILTTNINTQLVEIKQPITKNDKIVNINTNTQLVEINSSKKEQQLNDITITQKNIPDELKELTVFSEAENDTLDKFTKGTNIVTKFGIKGSAYLARTLVLSIQILYNNVVRDSVQLRSDLLEVVKQLGKQEKIKDGNGKEITGDDKFDTLIEMANSIKNINTFYNYGDIYVLFSKLKLFYNNSDGNESLITNAIDDSSEYFSYLFKSEEAKKASEAQRKNKSVDKRSLFYLYMAFLFNLLLLNVFAILVLKQMGITMPYDIVKFLGSVGSGLFFSSKGIFGGLLTTFSTTAKTTNASPELTSMIFQVLLSMI